MSYKNTYENDFLSSFLTFWEGTNKAVLGTK
jgi:hypothetical protein